MRLSSTLGEERLGHNVQHRPGHLLDAGLEAESPAGAHALIGELPVAARGKEHGVIGSRDSSEEDDAEDSEEDKLSRHFEIGESREHWWSMYRQKTEREVTSPSRTMITDEHCRKLHQNI